MADFLPVLWYVIFETIYKSTPVPHIGLPVDKHIIFVTQETFYSGTYTLLLQELK